MVGADLAVEDSLLERTDAASARALRLRLQRYAPTLRAGLEAVYPEQAAATYQRLVEVMVAAHAQRSPALRDLDDERLLNPDWLQRPDMVGYVAYPDRFAGTLAGVKQHLDYLGDLGVRYLHLMPLLAPRIGENDGGYAVVDYRNVRPDLGTMADLADLAGSMRARRISLVIDLVLNHVAAEHTWAQRAKAGDQKYRDYFLVFGDREQPDAYEQTLPEVFPDFAPGNFTFDPEVDGWVWTTFNSYQWDLNWANPDVLVEMADVICFLANQGVEVLRLDAIAFVWKRLGTNCQNQPEVHDITAILRAVARIVAPAMSFKAEAIVGPDDLVEYLGRGVHHGTVSDTAYHNALMVQLWSAVAARDSRLLQVGLSRFPAKPVSTHWSTYVRCHDDIGWAIADADAAAVGWSGPGHRSFLSDFYSGELPGSFARGLVFQHNPATNDRRISGTLASLAGLEQALAMHDAARIEDAIGRILLLHTVIFGFGGVPLIYMGDELAMLNDHDFAKDPDHGRDNRWVHRPAMDWDLAAKAIGHPQTPAGRVYQGIRHLIEVRARTPHLHASVESSVVPTADHRLLLLHRAHPLGPMVQLYNLSEDEVAVDGEQIHQLVGYEVVTDVLSNERVAVREQRLGPYQCRWLIGA